MEARLGDLEGGVKGVTTSHVDLSAGFRNADWEFRGHTIMQRRAEFRPFSWLHDLWKRGQLDLSPPLPTAKRMARQISA